MARTPFPIARPIALVGMMGAGKSSVGRRLARRLGLPFVDSDEEIARAAGLGIAELFERYGESQFRDGERRVIGRLVAGPPRVIATGGGAFAEPETRALILDRCTAVWLDAPADTLAGRVGRRGHRPLLGDADPLPALQVLADRRREAYGEAPIRIDASGPAHERVVDRIVEALRAGSR